MTPNSPCSSLPFRNKFLASSIASKHANSVGRCSATNSFLARASLVPIASIRRSASLNSFAERSPCAAAKNNLPSNVALDTVSASRTRRRYARTSSSASFPRIPNDVDVSTSSTARSTYALACTSPNPSGSSSVPAPPRARADRPRARPTRARVADVAVVVPRVARARVVIERSRRLASRAPISSE